MKHFDKPLPRVLTYLQGGGGGGGQGERTLVFSHICRFRPFWRGSKSFNFNIFGDFQKKKKKKFGVYVYINESIPPTHTQTLGIHACTSKCTRVRCLLYLRMRGSRFSLFSSAYFKEGPICLGPLPVSFFLMENYSTCINRPVRGPRMMR